MTHPCLRLYSWWHAQMQNRILSCHSCYWRSTHRLTRIAQTHTRTHTHTHTHTHTCTHTQSHTYQVSPHPIIVLCGTPLAVFPQSEENFQLSRNVRVSKGNIFYWALRKQSQQRQFMRAHDKHRTDAHACIHVRMHKHHRQCYTQNFNNFPPIVSICSALTTSRTCASACTCTLQAQSRLK